jgi:hypothetical protein
MARLSPSDACEILSRLGVSYDDARADFHRLPSDAVESLLSEAKARGYRQPRNANGSRARYFHAHLVRVAAREES